MKAMKSQKSHVRIIERKVKVGQFIKIDLFELQNYVN